MKRILFITSANLATNPRLVKELQLALQAEFTATVIQFRLGNYSDARTEELKSRFPLANFIELSALRKPFFTWFISTLLERIYCLVPVPLLNTAMASQAVSKRSYLLAKAIIKLNSTFDWVIAHNPAAFYPALQVAQTTGASLGIDVEDYHPGETNDPAASAVMKRLLQNVLPRANYCSFASPLIRQYIEKDVPSLNVKHDVVVNNIFSKNDFLAPPAEMDMNRKLRLVWFSQFIDYGRGLEQLFPAFDAFKESIEITLIGSLRGQFLQKEVMHRNYITCLAPLSQLELHHQLKNYDIGLCVEDSHKDANRNICLTNKIWAFFQAGLYILATATDAQKEFLEQRPVHGELIAMDPNLARITIESLLRRKDEIMLGRSTRYQNARSNCWENEADILLSAWDKKHTR